MQTMLLELQQELNKTIVFITHDLDEALRLGDSIVILRDGSIIQQGDSQDVLLRPADDYIERFIQDVNRGRYLKVDAILDKGAIPANAALPQLTSETTLETAAKVLAASPEDCALVVDGDGQPKGTVSLRKITAAISSAAEADANG